MLRFHLVQGHEHQCARRPVPSLERLVATKSWANNLLLQVVSRSVVLRAATCFIALILMTLDVTWAGSLERCIGAICIVHQAKTCAQLSANYPARRGSVLAMENPERTLCIYDKRRDISLVLTFSGDGNVQRARVDTLFLAKRDLCIGNGHASRRWRFALRTEGGIGLGSSSEEVEHRLGAPTRKVNAAAAEQTDTRYAETMYGSKFGAMRLYYESEEKSLWINEYGVDANNKVVSILLSNSP